MVDKHHPTPVGDEMAVSGKQHTGLTGTAASAQALQATSINISARVQQLSSCVTASNMRTCRPKWIILWASTAAVVVPSPAESLVRPATCSRKALLRTDIKNDFQSSRGERSRKKNFCSFAPYRCTLMTTTDCCSGAGTSRCHVASAWVRGPWSPGSCWMPLVAVAVSGTIAGMPQLALAAGLAAEAKR
eukprot:1157939-Pelagomonas_calceolata.AAC.3